MYATQLYDQKLAMAAICISIPLFSLILFRKRSRSARIVSWLFRMFPYAKRKMESLELEYFPVMKVRR